MASDNEGWVMGPGTGRDGYEDAQDEAARERQEAIDAKAAAMLSEAFQVDVKTCNACESRVFVLDWNDHHLNCEAAQMMAAAEVDRGR